MSISELNQSLRSIACDIRKLGEEDELDSEPTDVLV
jgi:hypothetical protein